MNFSLALKLMTLPSIMGSFLILSMVGERAIAIDATNARSLQASCDASPAAPLRSSHAPKKLHSNTLIASTGTLPDETEDFDFTEAESDASAVLFGCDCSSCINALRQLRQPSILDRSSSKGHCWTSMELRVSPEKVREVLQDLESQEAK